VNYQVTGIEGVTAVRLRLHVSHLQSKWVFSFFRAWYKSATNEKRVANLVSV